MEYAIAFEVTDEYGYIYLELDIKYLPIKGAVKNDIWQKTTIKVYKNQSPPSWWMNEGFGHKKIDENCWQRLIWIRKWFIELDDADIQTWLKQNQYGSTVRISEVEPFIIIKKG